MLAGGMKESGSFHRIPSNFLLFFSFFYLFSRPKIADRPVEHVGCRVQRSRHSGILRPKSPTPTQAQQQVIRVEIGGLGPASLWHSALCWPSRLRRQRLPGYGLTSHVLLVAAGIDKFPLKSIHLVDFSI